MNRGVELLFRKILIQTSSKVVMSYLDCQLQKWVVGDRTVTAVATFHGVPQHARKQLVDYAGVFLQVFTVGGQSTLTIACSLGTFLLPFGLFWIDLVLQRRKIVPYKFMAIMLG